MKESYCEVLASYTSLDSCGNCSNVIAKVLTEEWALTEGNTIDTATVCTQGGSCVDQSLWCTQESSAGQECQIYKPVSSPYTRITNQELFRIEK